MEQNTKTIIVTGSNKGVGYGVVDAVALRNVELLDLDGGMGVLSDEFLSGLVCEFQVATGHDNPPSRFAAERVNNSVANALVRASHDDSLGVLFHYQL